MLYWNSKESFGQRTEVGSMLKTPKFPVWLGIMGRNTVVVLFNTNINLINDWRLEQNFMLHFYGGLKIQDVDIKLEIGWLHIYIFHFLNKPIGLIISSLI